MTTMETAGGTAPTATGHAARTDDCTPVDRVTKSLLGYGAIAGPLYVVVSLGQALARDGFDLTRHQWSLLVNGSLGWIQVANFVVSGLMTIAFAVGLRRSLRPGRAATWGPRLLGTYGAGLFGAGVFRADPALGFPAGAPEVATVSWHGMAHFAVAGIGFACLAAAGFVVARRYAADGRRGWAIASRLVSVVFLTGFMAVASGGGSVAANLGFTVAVLVVSAWTSAVAVDRYRHHAAH